MVPDDVGVGEFLQQADLTHDAVLVHVVFVNLHHRHLATGVVHHLKDIGDHQQQWTWARQKQLVNIRRK